MFKVLFVLCLTITSAVWAQDDPGADITRGEAVYEPAGPPSNSGKLILRNDSDNSLHLDAYDIQSVRQGDFGGYIYLQDQGGCVNVARRGTAQTQTLRADTLKINGGVQTFASGQIAFGVISSAGAKNSGTPNWTSVYDSGAARYEITIDSESYGFTSYATLVTPNSPVALLARTGSLNGKLLVVLYDLSGNAVQGGFSFQVNKFVQANLNDFCGDSGPVLLKEGSGSDSRRLK